MLRRRRSPPARTGTPADWLVVGLGNPGREYDHTRHNVGADTVGLLAARHGARLRAGKEQALADEVRIGDRRVALAVPQQWMNDSGDAVRRLVRRYGVTPEQLVVVHDELDLPVAQLRIKAGGGLAGHNGLRSVRDHLHSDAFVRVRIGVGKPVSKERGVDHVLSRFSKRDQAEIAVTLEHAADAVDLLVDEGVAAAMNRYNATTAPP